LCLAWPPRVSSLRCGPLRGLWDDHRMNASGAEHRRFDGTDLSGAVFRDVDLTGATISGLISGLTVNEVEVGPLIDAELDRRYPERIMMRSDNPVELRRGWALVWQQWTATIQRIEQLPPRLQRMQIAGEWSALETLRHLVFVADDWFGKTVLAEPDPYWPAGRVPTFLIEYQSHAGIDPAADPDLAETLDRLHQRVAQFDRVVSEFTADDLARECRSSLSAGDVGSVTVLTCTQMMLDEFAAHRRYAERDLDALDQSHVANSKQVPCRRPRRRTQH
jgi:hypothetical protein